MTLEEPLPLAPGRLNELTPPPSSSMPAARQTWTAFYDHCRREVGRAAVLTEFGASDKLPEHAARVAGVLGVVADPRCTEITSGHIDAGIALAQHYAMEALRLFDAGSARPEILRAEQLLDWLNSRDGELISLPDVYQFGPNAFGDAKTALDAIYVLEDHGSLEAVEGGAIVNGINRHQVWRIVGRSP